ncbi:kelch-like protein 7 [Drosophila obscura]|uniref:kelch-like protein 7 n=1 Tax=Drosophila obscura TaxID=7282 RepID=UPI001BB2A43F|nr:kelch-like protein 7 [Drosophila obscura]
MNQDNESIEESESEGECIDSTPIPACSLREMGFQEGTEDFIQHLCSENEYKAHIIHQMNRLITHQQNTDVDVYVRGHKILCHLIVLKTCTEFAKDLHFPTGVIIAHKDVTYTGFKLAYEWMINENYKLQRKDIVELYLAAEYLKMPQLLDHLWSLFHEEKFVTDAIAFQIYLECLPHRKSKLQNLMLGRVQRFFLMAVATEEYLRLDHADVSEILDHSNMCVNSELEIYYSAVRWLHHDWPERKQHAPSIMAVVRFHLMTNQCISSIRAELQELHSIPAVQTLIDEALYAGNTQQKPTRREWVYNMRIPHHHNCACPQWRCLDLTTFDKYLELIIVTGPSYSKSLKYLTSGWTMPCCQSALLLRK